jgi:hypothetical protein
MKANIPSMVHCCLLIPKAREFAKVGIDGILPVGEGKSLL